MLGTTAVVLQKITPTTVVYNLKHPLIWHGGEVTFPSSSEAVEWVKELIKIGGWEELHYHFEDAENRYPTIRKQPSPREILDTAEASSAMQMLWRHGNC